jgi:uncharacterized protein YjdB
MKRKNFLKGAQTGGTRLINRKLFLLAGLITLILCFAFFACDLPLGDEVTEVKLSKTSLTIAAGDADYLTVTVPANAANVTWASNNTDYVTVSNGIIKAKDSAAGKTTQVTAKIGTKSASCTITITGDPAGTQVSGITLSSPSITMTVSETRPISCSISPAGAANKAVFWTSSAPGIAKVDSNSGVVTAVATGSAVITVTTKNKGRTATCNVTVSAPVSNPGEPSAPSGDDDKVTNITINKATLSLVVGSTEALTVTAQPATAIDYTVTWTSSDEAKATVDNGGLVTAVAAGTATITAKVGEFTDTCVVTVTAPTTAVVNLNKTNLTLFTTGGNNISTATLTATVLPATTTVTWGNWSSSDSTKVTVTGSGAGGNVTAVAKGTATITVAYTISSESKTATCIVTVVDPADCFGYYTGKYKNSSNKDITETVNISNSFVYITDNETPANPDYFDFIVDKLEPATTPDNLKATYPIALKITGKINDAKPIKADVLYGTSTAKGFTSSDITNKVTCWMFVYISSDGKIVRSPFNKTGTGFDNRTAPITDAGDIIRSYTK